MIQQIVFCLREDNGWKLKYHEFTNFQVQVMERNHQPVDEVTVYKVPSLFSNLMLSYVQ